jgi:hypothetical protein
MPVIAHIGNIPVEEWLPFVAPVVVLWLYGRHRDRRRRAAVQRLPDAHELLDEPTIERVVARWVAKRHSDAQARHLPVLYPPGPDGMTTAALADRAHCDTPTITRLLTELEDFGYLELDGDQGPAQKILLTIEGHDLVNLTEQTLLTAAHERSTTGA